MSEKIELLKLPNGLKIALLPQPNIKTVTIQLRGLAGSTFESDSEIGCAHVLEHILANNKYTKKVTNTGGKIIGVTSREDVVYGVHLLNKQIDIALDYLAEVFNPPLVNETKLNNLKSIVQSEIERHQDSPEKAIIRLSFNTLFPKQRLGKLNTGNIEDIEKMTPTKLMSFHKKHYLPTNFVLVVCGNFSHKKIMEKIKTRFSIPSKSTDYTYNKKPQTTSFLTVDTKTMPGINQVYIKVNFYGFKISDKLSLASEVFAKVADLIVKDVCQKKGLLYKTSVDSFSSRNFGIISFFFVTKKQNLPNLFNLIKKLLKALPEIIDEEVLKATKIQMETTIAMAFEKTYAKAEYFSEKVLHESAPSKALNLIRDIHEIKKRDVLEVIRHIQDQQPKFTVISKDMSSNDIRDIWANATVY